MRSRMLRPALLLSLFQILFWTAPAPTSALAQPVGQYDTLECTVRSRADYYEDGLPNLSVMGRYRIGDTFLLSLNTAEIKWSWASDADRFATVRRLNDDKGRVFLGITSIDSSKDSRQSISVLQVLDPWDDIYPFLLLEDSDFMTGACKVRAR